MGNFYASDRISNNYVIQCYETLYMGRYSSKLQICLSMYDLLVESQR